MLGLTNPPISINPINTNGLWLEVPADSLADVGQFKVILHNAIQGQSYDFLTTPSLNSPITWATELTTNNPSGNSIEVELPMNGNYTIELQTTNGVHIKTIANSTSSGIIMENWDLTDDNGNPVTDDIGNDSLGLDIMARGVLQDWLATMFNQYDQIAGKLLPAVEAAGIKPKIVPPIGEPFAAKRGAKVNLTN